MKPSAHLFVHDINVHYKKKQAFVSELSYSFLFWHQIYESHKFPLNIIKSHEYNELIMLMSAHYKRPKLTVLAEMVFVWSINYCEPSQSDAIGFQWFTQFPGVDHIS